jgi:6-phosphogluconolactonase
MSLLMRPEIEIADSRESLTELVSQRIGTEAAAAVRQRGRFALALSGGSSPASIYAALAEPPLVQAVPWQQTHFFWGDERHVLPDHADSNYRMVRQTLLDRVPVPEENIHRVRTELAPRMAAFHYEESLRAFFAGPWPVFDLVLLGMGGDGHTASLFPHSVGLNEEHRWFIANEIPRLNVWRLTLSFPAINAARQVWTIIRGEKKADMVVEVLSGVFDPQSKPIQGVQPIQGDYRWFLDRVAAQQLGPHER